MSWGEMGLSNLATFFPLHWFGYNAGSRNLKFCKIESTGKKERDDHSLAWVSASVRCHFMKYENKSVFIPANPIEVSRTIFLLRTAQTPLSLCPSLLSLLLSRIPLLCIKHREKEEAVEADGGGGRFWCIHWTLPGTWHPSLKWFGTSFPFPCQTMFF